MPVIAPDTWMREPDMTAIVNEVAEPGPARFMSEDEDSDEPLFFSSSQPHVATTVTVTAHKPTPLHDRAVEEDSSKTHVTETLAEALAMRDYSSDFKVDPRAEAGVETSTFEPRIQEPVQEPAGSVPLFADSDGEPQRDLDVPAFLRRVKF